MHEPTIVLISTDDSLIESVREAVDTVHGLQLDVLPDVDEALHHLEREELALLLIHVHDAHEDLQRLLRSVADVGKSLATVALSDERKPKQLMKMLSMGVADCLSRPLDINRLSFLLDSLTLRTRHALQKAEKAKAKQSKVVTIGKGSPFLYHTDDMGRMMDQVRMVAPQETTVLLLGETGTGKTRLAHLIHDLSDRVDEPFVTVHCGALAENLIESEMFGHVRGAFTGADNDRDGKFTEVGGGTMLLDDVDTLPLHLQVKLLRAVEERIFEPVGSNRQLPMRARLLVASNRNLEEEVRAGRFRQDLYYRLDVVSFHLSPLRARRHIIKDLAARFMAEVASKNKRDVDEISPDALETLLDYEWPGNIRELRHAIERAVSLCPGACIEREDLPEKMLRDGSTVPFASESLENMQGHVPTLAESRGEAELDCILKALDKHDNNRSRAAEDLGISRVTLYKKLRQHGLT